MHTLLKSNSQRTPFNHHRSSHIAPVLTGLDMSCHFLMHPRLNGSASGLHLPWKMEAHRWLQHALESQSTGWQVDFPITFASGHQVLLLSSWWLPCPAEYWFLLMKACRWQSSHASKVTSTGWQVHFFYVIVTTWFRNKIKAVHAVAVRVSLLLAILARRR